MKCATNKDKITNFVTYKTKNKEKRPFTFPKRIAG